MYSLSPKNEIQEAKLVHPKTNNKLYLHNPIFDYKNINSDDFTTVQMA